MVSLREVLEWPKGAVFKTAVEMRCTAINLVGSNPTLSICRSCAKLEARKKKDNDD